MTDEQLDWTNYIITTLVTAIGSAIGAILFLAKMIETKYVLEIKGIQAANEAAQTRHEKEMTEQKQEIQRQKIESALCQKNREELAIRIASLEANSRRLEHKNYTNGLEAKHQSDRLDTLEHRNDE